MFECVELKNGAFICIDNRLIVHQSFRVAEVMNFMRELRGVDEKYTSVFEVKSFVTYHGLTESTLSLINQMSVGDQISITETDIIKVADHLCVGIMKQVEYCYNHVAEDVPKEDVREKEIRLRN